MRKRSANAPTTDLAATIVAASSGRVSYALTAQDTAQAGIYAQTWVVTFQNGSIGTFPTVGYNTVEIQENLRTANQTIVELDDLKDYLNLSATDRTHDGELLRFLAGITPVIEFMTGPILPVTYTDERYDGGRAIISLRHRPLISVSQVSEYLGPIRYDLTQVPSRDQGSIYSYMFEPSGSIIRCTAGGGLQAFPAGPDSVQVTYTAGYLQTPENLRMGVLEACRVVYQDTQQAGGGRIGVGSSLVDETLPVTQMVSSFNTPRVRQFISPNRRHPATL